MKVFDLSEQKNTFAGIVAFGFFDAIHIGHRGVIEDAIHLAENFGVPSSVFLFENNIYPLIGIDKYPIYSFSERLHFIEQTGVQNVFYLRADEEILSMSPTLFLDYLSERINVVGFTCGEDFTFGKDGVGTPIDLIERFGDIYSVSKKWALELPPDYLSEIVSTEGVKRLLAMGDLRTVEQYLGRRFSIMRPVLEGRKDGSRIGFPTINQPLDTLPLKRGVYFSNVVLKGTRYPSITSVGAHPTFGDPGENVETYIIDLYRDLYDLDVEIEFLEYRREIESFASEEELARTIEADVEARMKYEEVDLF